jgi:hypothetical protein
MTTNAMHESKSSDGKSKEAKGLAIGESDANIFNCPSCARPLSEGTNKCPGCGVHLIMGVRLKRASAILALGVALGILIGGVTTAAAITVSLDDPATAVKPVASAAPSVAPVASVAPSFVAVDPVVPATAFSALSGTAVVNGRITVDAATLTATLARSNATTIDIARALRSLAADAALGIDLAGRLGTWTDAKLVRAGLSDFYQAMAEAAHGGLRASLNDAAAYRKAGADMIAVLATLSDIDSRSRALAGANGLELPPVAIPSSAPSAPD